MVYVSNKDLNTWILKFSICDFQVTDIVRITEKSRFNGDRYGTCGREISDHRYCTNDREITDTEPDGPHPLKKQGQQIIIFFLKKKDCIQKLFENKDRKLIFSLLNRWIQDLTIKLGVRSSNFWNYYYLKRNEQHHELHYYNHDQRKQR